MIMGDTCTRACAFCNVKTGLPGALDPNEPVQVGEATAKLGLAHIVVTSVDRDDLADGGAQHFAETIRAIRTNAPGTTIEVLTPDFLRKDGALEVVGRGQARRVQPQSGNRAIAISDGAAGRALFPFAAPAATSEGNRPADVHQVGDHGGPGRRAQRSAASDGRPALGQCRLLTIGQYLQPTRKHHEVKRFVPPAEFEALTTVAYAKGFLMVAASPLTRSSHHAGEDFARLKAARLSKA